MFLYKQEKLDQKAISLINADLSEGNDYITETAGFIPLEVKLKQFEQNGLVAQFMVSDFDSHDYRDIYLNPDYLVNPEDDLEDIQEKIALRNAHMKEIQEAKAKQAAEPVKEEAGPQEQKKAANAAKEAAEAAE